MPLSASPERDLLSLPETRNLSLSGFLGARLAANREGRLLVFPSDEMLLAGFQKRPGEQVWIGEHLGKWLHAAGLAMAARPDDAALAARFLRLARALLETQLPDGYLGTYLDSERWTEWDVWTHKYVLLGLLEYEKETGDPRALAACRAIGDLLVSVFGEGRRDIIAAGTHQGLAATSALEPMTLLYRRIGDERYRRFCDYLIARAEQHTGLCSIPEETGGVAGVGNGKAYEIMSNYVGLVEHWRGTGDPRALVAAKAAQASLARDYRFLTGAIDAHEHFSVPRTLVPTGRCTETCVQVTWEQLNGQLLRATGAARYADELHRHVYNHLLAAQHPDGAKWCYFTPLEGRRPYVREMNCCGSSGVRGVELARSFFVMRARDGLAVNFYETSEYRAEVGGAPVTLRQETDYPWQGAVRIGVLVERPVEFTLRLLIPFFAERATLDGEILRAGPGEYAELTRLWSGSSELELRFPMPVVAHHQQGRVALSRGPLFFACDAADHPGLDLSQCRPDVARLAECVFDPAGRRLRVPAQGGGTLLYRPLAEAGTTGQLTSLWMPVAPAILARPELTRAFTPPYGEWASRAGRMRHSFVDGEAGTYWTTDDGGEAEEDWFAVHFALPTRIVGVRFHHGRLTEAGGWWVVGEGERPALPVVEAQTEPGGPWRRVATLPYPPTTDASPGGVRSYAAYAARFDPVEVVAVRVVGRPARGSRPDGNYVSCGELEVLLR